MASDPPFVHLHVHSHYSLLDGVVPISQLIGTAIKNGMPAIALTDHGNMFGAVEFYQKATKQGIKPIIGCEFYVAPTDRKMKTRVDNMPAFFHLTLLAENMQGYRNLMKLSSIAYTEGFYYRPRIDRDILKENCGGLIALSGCLSGEASYWIRKRNRPMAERVLLEYADIFGRDSFFVELQDHGLEAQRAVRPALTELAAKTGLKPVATNDVHYLREEDAVLQDVMICIETGKFISDTDRLSSQTKQGYFKTAAEMAALFPESPQAISNTVEIAERCSLQFDFDTYHIPRFTIETGESADAHFERLVWEGIRERYPSSADTDEIRERTEYEMGIIRKLGFVDYFLITWDFIREAKTRGISVGPGRGSAAGSIVAYALKITDVDPLAYDLLFERFLNADRISMPDIDIDFSKTGRDEVIQYVRERYGRDNVAQIATFGTLKAKAALKDVGRVLGRPFDEMNRITKMVPDGPGVTLEKSLEDIPDLRAESENPDNRELFEIARKLEGSPRNLSTHAAGVVITPKPLAEFVPLCVVNEETNTQYPMTALEDIGLLKMDFLGLNTLTIIETALKNIKENRGTEIDLSELPIDDPETYRMLRDGDSLGVFQLESSGMQDVLRRLQPDRFTDLVALIALYRPGPMEIIPGFCDCKNGHQKVEYLHESLRDILEPTFGYIVYQEQVMRVAQKMASFTLNEGDTLRKAMGKKKPEIMARFEKKFIDGAAANGVAKDTAAEVWSFIERFAGYGFNKSHATAYAVIAFRTAYLKCHFAPEYMAALMTCEMGNTDKIVQYRTDAEKRGVPISPPDVMKSRYEFAVMGDEVMFGLGAVKGIGEKAIEAIVEARERLGSFRSLYHFCEEVDLRAVNRGVIDALVKCGAFDCLEAHRSQLLAVLDDALRCGQVGQRDRRNGQMNLFAGGAKIAEPPLPDMPEFEVLEKLRFEKETLGFYLSGHPLEAFRNEISTFITHSTAAFLEAAVALSENGNLFEPRNGKRGGGSGTWKRERGPQFILGGLITSVRRITTKRGDPMAFAQLADFEGTVEVVVFPGAFQDVKDYLVEDAVVFCRGTANTNRATPTLAVEEVIPVAGAPMRFSKCCIIRLTESDLDNGATDRIKSAVREFEGPTPLYIQIDRNDGCKILAKCGDDFKVSICDGFQKAVIDCIGPGRIHVRGEAGVI
ncbi:MAG: DNA polymerase III subunit alpha [Planctomycetota bacterium]|jgi:DNA polymerase-3 subunit alpha